MGAWGFSPKDNDSSSDATSTLLQACRKHLETLFKNKKSLDAWDRWTRLGVVDNLLAAAPSLIFCVKEKALEDIEILIKDDDFLKTWKHVPSVKAKLKVLKAKLTRKDFDEWLY
jgi:hypothetical protein